MRAPAMYSATDGPGTFEIATLASAGKRVARSDRPYSDAMPVMNHGEPAIGRSVPSIDFRPPINSFDASDDSRIALKRLAGSARSVARSTRIAETWLLFESSSASRRLTGTIAIRSEE